MTRLVLPDPSLVVLVGAAGAGKSTFAACWFAPDEVLSSDALRARLAGDEADQRVSRLAFAILHLELERRMAARVLTVVDATNIDRRARRELLGRAAAHGIPTVAVVLAPPTPVVLARNAARARHVDEAVVRRQLERVRLALGPGGLSSEPFGLVWVGRSVTAIDALEVVRVSSR